MDDPDSTAMDAEERDERLGTGGTGVIAFAGSHTDPPHAVPVSYGYDEGDATFYFRLAVGSDSEKAAVVDNPVTFVTYGQADGAWWSVVARGRLQGTTDEAVAMDALEGLRRVHIPLVDIFGRPPKDVPFEFYRLAADEVTARTESRTGV
ncbi:MAG: pyridoxamine 5'-phosphate oxidase family protein [Haloferacaceae archaeon]